ncbi:MAG: nucleotide exchange factor GrpE [Beijerinckiaceae bacterium]
MTDETKQATQTDSEATAAADAAALDPIAVLEAEKLELKDKLLRTLAELENLRRRTERDMADARTYAVTNFARDMLNVADNIARALQTAPPDAEGPVKAFVDGVSLTERDLLKTLERFGVKKLEPEGQKFDPNMHQAMFEVPDATKPNGTVTTVVQAGYSIGERCLRPAMVGVSKGAPKVAPVQNGAGEG